MSLARGTGSIQSHTVLRFRFSLEFAMVSFSQCIDCDPESRLRVKSGALASRAMSPYAGCGHWSAPASVGQAVQLCLGLHRASDADIMARAIQEQRTIVTADLD